MRLKSEFLIVSFTESLSYCLCVCVSLCICFCFSLRSIYQSSYISHLKSLILFESQIRTTVKSTVKTVDFSLHVLAIPCYYQLWVYNFLGGWILSWFQTPGKGPCLSPQVSLQLCPITITPYSTAHVYSCGADCSCMTLCESLPKSGLMMIFSCLLSFSFIPATAIRRTKCSSCKPGWVLWSMASPLSPSAHGIPRHRAARLPPAARDG